jgi:hypothetical protein
VLIWAQGSIYWKLGNKYGLRGKNIIKTMCAPTKKGEKERKDKGNENKSDKKDRKRTMFHKIMGNLEKMQAIGDIISYFFPYAQILF